MCNRAAIKANDDLSIYRLNHNVCILGLNIIQKPGEPCPSPQSTYALACDFTVLISSLKLTFKY